MGDMSYVVKGAGPLDKFVCHEDRILVEFNDAAKVTKGGILLPEQVKRNRQTKGRVVAVGPQVPKQMVVGTIVWVLINAGADVSLEQDDEEREIGTKAAEYRYRVLSHHDVFGYWLP